MTPRLFAATLSAVLLIASPTAFAQARLLSGAAAVAPATGEPAATAELDQEQEPEENEETSDSGEEFCGGDSDPGMELVWAIEEDLSAGNVGDANRDVVRGFRRRAFSGSSRFPALLLLAETRLRLGRFARALGTYRRAFRVGRPDASDPAHVGMAVALLRAGHTADAREEASAFVAAACEAERPSDSVACYGARLVIAASFTDATARAAALSSAEATRAAEQHQATAFDRMRALVIESRAS